jgi:hypothetical protein
VHHRTDDGRAFRMLNILDEFSRECLEIWVKRNLNSADVVDALTTCSSCAVFRHLFTQATALSSAQKSFTTGSPLLVQRPLTSN